jgi:hypothetical protein
MYFQNMNKKLHINPNGSGSFEYRSKSGLHCTPGFQTIQDGRGIIDRLKSEGEVDADEHLQYSRQLDAWKPTEEKSRIIIPNKDNASVFADVVAALTGKAQEGGGIIPVKRMPRSLRFR